MNAWQRWTRKDLLPQYIKDKDHNDWPPGLRWVPRRWTSFCFPMGPLKFAGNTKEEIIFWANNPAEYPLASDVQIVYVPTPNDPNPNKAIMGYSPVPAIGCWHILNCKLFKKLPRIPCFFAMSLKLFGKRVHFNIGMKPDVTDWHWGFPETSFTLRDLKSEE